MKRAALVLALLLSTVLPGCNSGPSEREQLEQSLPSQITTDLNGKGIKSTCTKLALVESEAHHYRGTAYYADGSSGGITVVAGDGGVTWKMD